MSLRAFPLPPGSHRDSSPPDLIQFPSSVHGLPGREYRRYRFSWWALDSVWLSCGLVLLLFFAFSMQRGRIFWEDEMLGWLLLRDPSWHHMISSWKVGADGGGFSFYLTGRLWFALFGNSVLSFRAYSAAGMAAAFAIIWVLIRRYYSPAVTAFAMISIWLSGPALLGYAAEGRFYGLMMAACAASIALYFYTAERTVLARSTYVLVFLAHALLTTSHLLGVAYSATIVLAMAIVDKVRGRWRPRLYLAAMLSWLFLLPSLPAIHASAMVGKPHFWTEQPGFQEFVKLYTGLNLKAALLVGTLLLFVLVHLLHKRALRPTLKTGFTKLTSVYLLIFLFFLLPVVFLLEGYVGTPLCNRRYLLPIELVVPFFMAELSTLALAFCPGALLRRRWLWRSAAVALMAVIIVFGLSYSASDLHSDYTGPLTAALPRGVPIVCEDAFAFTELIGREHDSGVRYVFLLDWKNSVDPDAPKVEVTQYHLMQNWKKVGFFSGSIEYRSAFLAKTPVFYVLRFDDFRRPHFYEPPKKVKRANLIGNNLHEEFASDPNYRVTLYKELPLGEQIASVWKVERLGPASGKSLGSAKGE